MNKRNKFGKVSVNCTENNRKNVLIDISDHGILLPTYTSGRKEKKKKLVGVKEILIGTLRIVCVFQKSHPNLLNDFLHYV